MIYNSHIYNSSYNSPRNYDFLVTSPFFENAATFVKCIVTYSILFLQTILNQFVRVTQNCSFLFSVELIVNKINFA